MSVRRTILTGAAVAGVIALSATGGAIAAGQIGSAGIKDDSLLSVDYKDGSVKEGDASQWMQSQLHKVNELAALPTLDGAVYRVANYSNGGGGRATVACGDDEASSQEYVAIAGGARVEVPGAGTNTEDITASFPGRMDWSTNLPKPDRLDGWVVYFGDGAAPSPGNGVLEIWALCVPSTGIETQVNTY